MYDSVFINVGSEGSRMISHPISFTKVWQWGFNAGGESVRTQNSTDIGSQFLTIMILMMVEVSRTGANAKLKFILQNGVRVSSCPSLIQNGPISKMVSASPNGFHASDFPSCLNIFYAWSMEWRDRKTTSSNGVKFQASSTDDFASPKMDWPLFPVVGHQKWSNTL